MAKVRITPKTGDPIKTTTTNDMVLSPTNPITQHLDVRDRLAELVGQGNNLNPDNKSAILESLAGMYGKDKAMKIMNHAYIFNTRPDIQKLPLEEKLKAFYTIGSNDPDVQDALTSVKNLGYGVVPGFRESSSDINQQLTGRQPITSAVSDQPELKKKVMLRIGK